MAKDDKEALKEFRSGAAVTIGIVGVGVFLFLSFSDWVDRLPPEQHSPVVVDTYKGCDVGRYNRQGSGRYE